jgi:hypothetical protein
MKVTCVNCGDSRPMGDSGFWSLNKYYGLSGMYCRTCYNKVSHDSYGKPENPEEYLMILLKQGFKR